MERKFSAFKELIIFLISLVLLIIFIIAAALRSSDNTEVLENPDEPTYEIDYDRFPDKFFYNQLSNVQKREFQKIYDGILEYKQSIPIEGLSVEDLNKLIYLIHFDCPEIFYLSSTSQNYNFKGNKVTTYYPQYTYTEETIRKMQEEIDLYTEFFLDEIGEMSEEETELYIHNYIIKNVKYSQTTENFSNIYGAFIEGSANCRGYSAAFTYLCRLSGLNSAQIIGYATDKTSTIGHSWNVVQLDSVFYYVDVCWNDLDNSPAYGSVEGIYAYYNLPSNKMALSHNPSESLALLGDIPIDKDSSRIYYKEKGMYAEKLTDAKSIIASQIPLIAAKKTNIVVIQCDNKDVYNSILENSATLIKECIESHNYVFFDCKRVEIPGANTIIFSDFGTNADEKPAA